MKTPRSVYAAIPGRNKYRPSQETPIPNFTLAGDWTSQKFLGSMEGAGMSDLPSLNSIRFVQKASFGVNEFSIPHTYNYK